MPPTNSTREIHPAARARFAPSFVSTGQRFALNAIAVLALMAAGKPASAEYFTYQGQMQIQTIAGDVCSSLLSENTFNIVVYGRDDGPQRIDGYLYGDKIVHAHITGNGLNQLSLTFPGESASHAMRLRMTGEGSFAGELPAKSLVSALSFCKFSNAQIKFARIATRTREAYEQAANLFQSDARAVQAYVLGTQGKIKEALPALQEALTLKEKAYGAGHPQLLANYFLLAQIHEAEGSYPDELPLYRKAIAVCDQAYGPESPCAGVMLTYASGALLQNGNNGEAESSVRRALAICDKVLGPEAPVSGIGLNTLGAVLIYTGRYGEAEATLNRALAINKKSYGPENANVGISLNDLGALYRFTGQYGRAEAALRQALAIDEKALGHDGGLTILNRIVLAQILRVSGQYAAAEPLAREALATAEKVLGPERPDHPALSKALIALAEILRETGRYGEAEPLYRRALANSLKYLGPEHPDVATISMLLAKQLRATGRDAEASTLLIRAYRISHVSDNQMITWRVPGELMQLYGAGKSAKPTVAIFYGKEAVNDLQQLRGNLKGSANGAQEAFVSAAEVSSVYRTLADLLIADDRLSEAQQVLAMLKEQEFYDFTERSSDSSVHKTVATLNTPEKELDELSGKDVVLGKEYGALQAKFTKDHQLSPQEHERLNTLRKAMDAAQANFDARAAAIAKSANDPEAQKRRQHEINDYSRAFQGTLRDLGHDAVLAQYFILDDKVSILLTTPNVVIARDAVVKRDELNEQIRAYRKTLSNATQDPVPQASALYRLLVAPIADDLRQAGAKTLMLSLDDTLRYLPFAALYDGKHYLIENLAIVMVTEAVRDKLAKLPAANWTVWGLGVTKGGPGFAALPYVGMELNGIAGQKGILSGKVLLDTAFNEGSLRDGLDQAYPIIHIASHFQFTPGSMHDSFLLLGDGSRMTLAQIRTKLNFSSVDLLTLSACETALGDDSVAHHGIEVEGLGAIAQQAGAKAVLATLWPVADSSTALLMRKLYQAHKVDHLDKAEALREAQLALLRGTEQADGVLEGKRGLTRVGTAQTIGNFKSDPNAPFAHPFFWAPFILMGNWL
jgi:CHAT domain-containing protein